MQAVQTSKNPLKQTVSVLPFGTKVCFGNNLEGEVVHVSLIGPDMTPIYIVQWWELEAGRDECELFESQFKVIQKILNFALSEMDQLQYNIIKEKENA